MACPRCDELNLVWLIRTPGELRKAIRIVRGNVDDGTIRPRDDDPVRGAGDVPFSELREAGPWSDILVYRFDCTSCAQGFELFAMTYKGDGSRWHPIGPSDAAENGDEFR